MFLRNIFGLIFAVGFIHQESYAITSEVFETFRCDNGEYIGSHRFCDIDPNCADSSDESEERGCKKTGCGYNEFTCNNDEQCIHPNSICDSIEDCDDGSDERNCGNQLNVNNCSLADGNFLCHDKKRCIDSKFVCDTYSDCNCFDCSDENNSTICKEPEWNDEILLIYSTDSEIKSLNKTINQTSTLVSGVNCTKLTAVRGYLYYATSQNKPNKNAIFKMPLGANAKEPEKLIDSESPITSMAVDYITGNVYFTSNGSLFVCVNNGKICTLLRCCNVLSVAVAPKFGLMFYLTHTDWGFVVIMKSNMDGSDSSDLICFLWSHVKSHPNAVNMEVNEQMKRLVFSVELWSFSDSDYRNLVAYLSLNKTNKGNIEKNWASHSDIVSISSTDSIAFYIKKNDNNIYCGKHLRIDKKCWTNVEVFNDTNDLFAYNPRSQNFTENPCASASCSGICLLSPPLSGNSSLTYTCLTENIIRTNILEKASSTEPVTQNYYSSTELNSYSPASHSTSIKIQITSTKSTTSNPPYSPSWREVTQTRTTSKSSIPIDTSSSYVTRSEFEEFSQPKKTETSTSYHIFLPALAVVTILVVLTGYWVLKSKSGTGYYDVLRYSSRSTRHLTEENLEIGDLERIS